MRHDPWPRAPDDLIALQSNLGRARPPSPWRVPPARIAEFAIAGVWVCFPRGLRGPGAPGDPAWAAAVMSGPDAEIHTVVQRGGAGAAYAPGLLALREGPLLAGAVVALPDRPDVLLVNATGRDHPRRAGLALHLGAVLDIPTIGVTHRPLGATGEWPPPERGATSPLILHGETVGAWLRTQSARRPLAVHAAWRTDVTTAIDLTLRTTRRARTPEPLRLARRAARRARAGAAADR